MREVCLDESIAKVLVAQTFYDDFKERICDLPNVCNLQQRAELQSASASSQCSPPHVPALLPCPPSPVGCLRSYARGPPSRTTRLLPGRVPPAAPLTLPNLSSLLQPTLCMCLGFSLTLSVPFHPAFCRRWTPSGARYIRHPPASHPPTRARACVTAAQLKRCSPAW